MKNILILFLVFSATSLFGQDTEVVLTLDECIATALENNLTIKQAKNMELIAKSNKFQALMNHLPSLNAQANYDFFFGTTFDVNAARQVTATTNSSSPRITSSVVVFNGLSRHYNRKQMAIQFEGAKNDTESSKIQTEAGILESYLQVILGEENIRISGDRVVFLEAQLNRAEKRESVGVGNMEEVFNFRSQLATEKLNLQTLKNAYESSKLALLQSMRLDITEADYAISPILISEESLLDEIEPFDQILGEILNTSPFLLSAQYNRQAAKYQFRSAWGQRLPTVSVFGMFGSNYSSNGARNPETDELEPNATYRQQIGYNEFQYINFSLNIPIFNQFQTGNQVQVAKLNVANSELAEEQATQTITNAVQQIYLDLIAAQTTYQSALENMDALQQSFDFMTRRYETGNTDFYTYLESLNNKNRAEIQLINAKYSILLRKRILDTYRRL